MLLLLNLYHLFLPVMWRFGNTIVQFVDVPYFAGQLFTLLEVIIFVIVKTVEYSYENSKQIV